jgi:aminopeptidase N
MIGDAMEAVDPAAIHAAREALRASILADCEAQLWEAFHESGADAFDLSPRAKGLRRLKGVSLSALMAGDGHEATAAAFLMFCDAEGMTDRVAALLALAGSRAVERDEALARFRADFGHVPTLLDKWFAVQAGSARRDTLEQVKALAADPQFDPRNPNRARALLLGFASNQARFHCAEGYRFIADHILSLDSLNPGTAARLALPLARWKRMIPALGQQMKTELQRIAAAPDLSKDVREVVGRALD